MRHAQNNSWHGLLVTQLVMHTTLAGHVRYLCSCTPRDWVSAKFKKPLQDTLDACNLSIWTSILYVPHIILFILVEIAYSILKANMLNRQRFFVIVQEHACILVWQVSLYLILSDNGLIQMPGSELRLSWLSGMSSLTCNSLQVRIKPFKLNQNSYTLHSKRYVKKWQICAKFLHPVRSL